MKRSQAERLAVEISGHKGEWVIIKNSHVIASAPSMKRAIEIVPKGQRAGAHAQYSPREDFSTSSFSAH